MRSIPAQERSSDRPTPQPHLDTLRPYQAARMTEPPAYDLSANEACLGPSPRATEAASSALATLERYPDGGATLLRQAIAQRYRLDADRIICSAGSEELISWIVQAYASVGDEVLFPQFGFIKYELAARAYGAIPVRSVDREYTADIDSLLGAVTPRTRIVFIANPNNPTGTTIPAADLRRLRAGLRDDILLVIDSAYAEFVERQDYEDGNELAAQTVNTVMLRTFSKIHGLAGLRCGWGTADREIVDALHKVRGAFNVGAVAQAAATAAISDLDHEQRARQYNAKARMHLANELDAIGLKVLPSECNFLAVIFDGAEACAEAASRLSSHGVLAMRLSGYGLPQAIRISVGTEAANAAVVAALALKELA